MCLDSVLGIHELIQLFSAVLWFCDVVLWFGDFPRFCALVLCFVSGPGFHRVGDAF